MFQMSNNVNTLANDWSALFSSLFEKHALLGEMCVSEKYYHWIDKNLKGLMINRDRLKKAALKS